MCPDPVLCERVGGAVGARIPGPVPDGYVLVIALSCRDGDDCSAGIHAMAVLVPVDWRLGDSFSAWSVDGAEAAPLATPWELESLPEDVLSAVRGAVEGP